MCPNLLLLITTPGHHHPVSLLVYLGKVGYLLILFPSLTPFPTYYLGTYMGKKNRFLDYYYWRQEGTGLSAPSGGEEDTSPDIKIGWVYNAQRIRSRIKHGCHCSTYHASTALSTTA